MERTGSKGPGSCLSCCPAQLEAEGPPAGGVKSSLVIAHLGTAEFKTSFEFGSSSPSCPPFPWSRSELGTCPRWNLGFTLPCGRFQKQRDGACRRPPHKVTKRRQKVKNNSLKIQDKICFLPFPSTVLGNIPSASTF